MSDNNSDYGILYPTGHAVAVLPSDEAARRGRDALVTQGINASEIEYMSGSQVAEHIRKREDDAGWMDRLKQALAVGVGTEGQFWKEDYEHARSGAGFLVIRCESGATGETIRAALLAEKPLALRRYGKLAIEDLLADTPG